MQKQFVLEWDKALGWRDNPFQEKIFEPVENFLVGYEKERQKLNLFVIEGYKFGILVGDEGAGKTTLLRWIRSQLLRYTGKFSAVYINARNLAEREFIKAIVAPETHWWEQFTQPWKKLHIGNIVEFLAPRLQGKKMIILLDEAHMLSRPDILTLKHLFDSSLHIQLLVAGSPEEMKRSIVATLGQDRADIELRGLSYHEIKEMLALRIEALGGHGIDPFDESMLKHLVREHQNNPRQILLTCNDHAIKLSLKQAFSKKTQHAAPKEKLVVIENVEETEATAQEAPKKSFTDIFLPGLFEAEKAAEATPLAQTTAETDTLIQQAAEEIEEAAKHGRKKRK